MALYLPELDAVFVHVPKCGGTWVKSALSLSGLECLPSGGPGEHGLPSAYREAGRRFMFVRHPLCWYESAWMGLRGGWPARRAVAELHRERTWSPIRMLTYLAGASSFDEFVRVVLAEQPGFCSRMFEWYAGPPGAPSVTHVGRQESLRADLGTILTELGWSGELADVPLENVNDGERPVWDPVLKACILEAESFGISRWYGGGRSPFCETVG